MAMHFSEKEQRFHHRELFLARNCLKLTLWEEGFLDSIQDKKFEDLSPKQRAMVSRIWEDRKDSA